MKKIADSNFLDKGIAAVQGFGGGLKQKAVDLYQGWQTANTPASQYLTDKLWGDSQWAKENPRMAQGLTFLGIPAAVGLGLWALNNSFSKKKKKSSLWNYLLPMMGIGGVLWGLGANTKAGDLRGLFGSSQPAASDGNGAESEETPNPPKNSSTTNPTDKQGN